MSLAAIRLGKSPGRSIRFFTSLTKLSPLTKDAKKMAAKIDKKSFIF